VTPGTICLLRCIMRSSSLHDYTCECLTKFWKLQSVAEVLISCRLPYSRLVAKPILRVCLLAEKIAQGLGS
jgi:hypothetical protein